MLSTTDDSKVYPRQHRKPCHDCPWARQSVPGWIGPNSIGEWIRCAHSDAIVDCHTRRQPNGEQWQCAGMAIYRANVVKLTRAPGGLILPPDKVRVFTWHEFEAHHGPAIAKMGGDNETRIEDIKR